MKQKYEECYIYLGHNSHAFLYNSLEDFFFIEEEKENRNKGGEYIPFCTLAKLAKYEIGTIYVINHFSDSVTNKIINKYYYE